MPVVSNEVSLMISIKTQQADKENTFSLMNNNLGGQGGGLGGSLGRVQGGGQGG